MTDEKAAESAAAGGDLQLLPLGIHQEEFKKFFEDYRKKIDYTQRNSFADVDTCIKQMKNGYDQHYLKFTRGKEIEGFVCFNLDHTWQNDFRAYIRHISVVDKTKFEEALKMAV